MSCFTVCPEELVTWTGSRNCIQLPWAFMCLSSFLSFFFNHTDAFFWFASFAKKEKTLTGMLSFRLHSKRGRKTFCCFFFLGVFCFSVLKQILQTWFLNSSKVGFSSSRQTCIQRIGQMCTQVTHRWTISQKEKQDKDFKMKTRVAATRLLGVHPFPKSAWIRYFHIFPFVKFYGKWLVLKKSSLHDHLVTFRHQGPKLWPVATTFWVFWESGLDILILDQNVLFVVNQQGLARLLFCDKLKL